MKILLFFSALCFACVGANAQAKLEFDLDTTPAQAGMARLRVFNEQLYFNAYGYLGDKQYVYDPASQQLEILRSHKPCEDSGRSLLMHQGFIYLESNGLVRYNPANKDWKRLTNSPIYLAGGQVGAVVVQDKIFFTAYVDNYSKLKLFQFDLVTEKLDTLDFSSVGGKEDLEPDKLVATQNSVYFIGRKSSPPSQLAIFRYDVATQKPIALPTFSATYGFFPSDMVSCNGQLYLYFSEIHGNIGFCRYQENSNAFQTISTSYTANHLLCFDEKIFGTSELEALWSYDPATTTFQQNYDVIPGVAEKIYFMRNLQGTLLVSAFASDSFSIAAKPYIYQPDASTFLPMTGIWPLTSPYAIADAEQINKIGDDFYFVGSPTPKDAHLMRWKPGEPAATDLADVNTSTDHSYYTKIFSCKGKAYGLVSQNAKFVEFDTGAVANPVVLSDLWSLDNLYTFADAGASNEDVFLSPILQQGMRYGLGRYTPGDQLQTYLPVPNTDNGLASDFTYFNGKTYFAYSQSAIISGLAAFDHSLDTAGMVLMGSIHSIMADAQYLYYFTDSSLYRFDGVHAPEQLLKELPLCSQHWAKPSIHEGFLYFFTQADPNTDLYHFERLNLTTLDRSIYLTAELYFELSQAWNQGKLYLAPSSNDQLHFFEFDPVSTTVRELLINHAPLTSQSNFAYNLTSFEGNLLFASFSTDYGTECHIYDPITSDATLLFETYTGYCEGLYWNPTVIGPKLYFTANDGIHGAELWSYRSCFQANVSATPSTIGQSIGSASVNTTGGSAPFTYQWSNGATTATLENIPSGLYLVTTTDANGCQSTLSVYVDAIVSLGPELGDVQLRVYPNPFGQRITIEATQPQAGFQTLPTLLQVQLLDLQGRIISSSNWESSSPLVLDGLDLPSGVYFLRLRQMSNGVMRTVKVVCP